MTNMEKDEETSEKSLPEKDEKKFVGYPIDHGWSWMVMLGALGMHVFNVGGLKSFGVLFHDLQQKFAASSSEIAGVYSLAIFLMFALGPLANALGDRFSYRCVIICGGILIGVGFLLTSFVKSLWLFFISYGIISGIGLGLSYSPFIVMVGYHFDKRRSLAMGLSVSGSGLGSFLLPNIMRYMLYIYNIDQVMLILAAAMTNVCVCGCLIRPIEYYRSCKRKLLNEPEKPIPENMEVLLCQTDDTIKNTENYLEKNELISNPNKPRMNSILYASSITSGSLGDVVIIKEELTNNVRDLEKEKSCTWFKKLFSCMKTEDSDDKKENGANCLLDCSLLLDPVFLIYGFALFFSSFGYMNIFIIIPSHAEDLGMSDSQGAFIVSLTGLSDIFGRLFFGWLADLKLISRQYQFFLSLFCCGIAIGLLPFIYSYVGLAINCWFIGLFAGAYIALVPIVLVDVLGLEKLSSSLGLAMLFVSVGMLLGPPAVGWIRDASQRHWRNSLFFCASFSFLGAAMVIFEPLAKRYKKRQSKEKENDRPITHIIN